MNPATNTSGAVLRQRSGDSPTHCSICTRRLGRMLFAIEEDLEGHDATSDQGVAVTGAPATLARPTTWSLCKDCYAAVEGEVRRAQLQTAYRIRIALGIVASERGPKVKLHFWQEAYWDNDKAVQRWLWWTIMIVAFGHMGVFLVIMIWPSLFP